MVGTWVRQDFLKMASGVVLASVLAKDAVLAVNPNMRVDVLSRSARLACDAAEALWGRLSRHSLSTYQTLSDDFVEHAVRNMAAVVGWWGELVSQTGDSRETGLAVSAETAVEGAAILGTELASRGV